MTTDTTSKISENPKKKKQIRRSDEGWEVWSRNYRLPPLGVARENKTEIFYSTTLNKVNKNVLTMATALHSFIFVAQPTFIFFYPSALIYLSPALINKAISAAASKPRRN